MADEHAAFEKEVGQEFFADAAWTWRDRWRERLFPTGHAPCPELPIVGVSFGDGDVVVTRVRVAFSFLDRLRVLLTGKVMVEVRVACERVVGRTTSTSAAWPVTRFR